MRYQNLCRVAAVSVALLSPSVASATLTDISQPGNVLAGSIPAASSSITLSFPPTHAVDNKVRFCCAADQDHGAIFDNTDSSQRLGMTGTYGAIQQIRIWTLNNVVDARIPVSVLVRSSTASLSGIQLVTAGSFETLLGTFPLGTTAFTGTAPNTDNTFATVAVNAPLGTQSLYFDFGPVLDGKGERIAEIQAFVPEPTSLALVSMSLVAFAGCRRSRRAG